MTNLQIEDVVSCNNCGSESNHYVGGGRDFEYETCLDEFSFVSCEACGLVWLKTRPAISELTVIYPKEYIPHRFHEHLGSTISRLRSRVQKFKVNKIKDLMPEKATIIDVGPGNGEFLDLIRRHGRAHWDLWGIDFSSEAVTNLEQLGFRAIESRFEEVEWQAEPPHLISMNQVIEHLDDPASAIEKAYDMLAPGGYIFIETPSTNSWDYNLFKKRYWGGWHTPRHWVLYDEKSLQYLLEAKGFEVVETNYLLSPNFWLQSMHHLIDEKLGWKKVADYFDVAHFMPLCIASGIDVIQRAVTKKTSNFRMIGRKPL